MKKIEPIGPDPDGFADRGGMIVHATRRAELLAGAAAAHETEGPAAMRAALTGAVLNVGGRLRRLGKIIDARERPGLVGLAHGDSRYRSFSVTSERDAGVNAALKSTCPDNAAECPSGTVLFPTSEKVDGLYARNTAASPAVDPGE